MKKGFIFAFLLTGVAGIFAWAEVKPLMHQMFDDIFNLKPYIVSEDAFKNPKNSDAILKFANSVLFSDVATHHSLT